MRVTPTPNRRVQLHMREIASNYENTASQPSVQLPVIAFLGYGITNGYWIGSTRYVFKDRCHALLYLYIYAERYLAWVPNYIGVRYTPLRRYLATPAAAHDPRSVSRVLRQALAWLLKAYPVANLGLR